MIWKNIFIIETSYPNLIDGPAVDPPAFVEDHVGHDLATHLAERVAEERTVDAWKWNEIYALKERMKYMNFWKIK